MHNPETTPIIKINVAINDRTCLEGLVMIKGFLSAENEVRISLWTGSS